jgi:hypothetical protein
MLPVVVLPPSVAGMCFSRAASFSACAIIGLIAMCALWMNFRGRVVRTIWSRILRWKSQDKLRLEDDVLEEYPEEELKDAYYWVPFLSTPLLFAVQQGCEGGVWLRLEDGGDTSAPGTAFSFFAYAFWPMWVPFICLLVELRPINRIRGEIARGWIWRCAFLSLLLLVGITLFVYLISSIGHNGLYATSTGNRVEYHFEMFGNPNSFAVLIPYLACTIVSFLFATSVYAHWFLALAIIVAAVIAYTLFVSGTFPSVWCFLAAWLSLIMVVIRIVDIIRLSHRIASLKPHVAPPSQSETLV